MPCICMVNIKVRQISNFGDRYAEMVIFTATKTDCINLIVTNCKQHALFIRCLQNSLVSVFFTTQIKRQNLSPISCQSNSLGTRPITWQSWDASSKSDYHVLSVAVMAVPWVNINSFDTILA